MITRLGVENRNINSIRTLSAKKDFQENKNPNFKENSTYYKKSNLQATNHCCK